MQKKQQKLSSVREALLIDYNMDDKNVIGRKTKEFAVAAVLLFKDRLIPQSEFILSKQFLRSATSVGANVAEATGAYSRKDFSHKMSIAYKESREASYWLEIFYESGYLNKDEFEKLFNLITEINKLLFSIVRTTQSNHQA